MNKLICFTFAGGTASFFDEIERDLLPASIEVIKPEYAGHGARHKEKQYDNFSALADDMFASIKGQLTGGEYSLFGYSMGAITLIEVLKRILASSELPQPKHVFIAAHEPHTKKELLSFTPDELDEWVKKRTISFGTVPEKLIDNKTFWRMYLPLYRHDYTMLAGYDFNDLHLKTKIPATIFYSETDTPLDEMRLWGKYFVDRIEYYKYEGQHFFIHQHHEEMAGAIMEALNDKF